MFHLAKYFAIEIDAYAILSNHFHLVIYFDPTISQNWTDEDVAFRWVEAFPPREGGKTLDELKAVQRSQLLRNKTLLDDRRKKLSCLSTFMKHLKQPIALRANKEDGCKGHFFEHRFYSGAPAERRGSISFHGLCRLESASGENREKCKAVQKHFNISSN